MAAHGLGLQRLDGFEGLNVCINSLDVSGNALFLDSFLDFQIRELNLGAKVIGDEVLR